MTRDATPPLAVTHFTLADGGGGAAGAVRRLHRELARQGVRSRLCVARKHTTDVDTIDLSADLLLGTRAIGLSRRLDLIPVRLRHPRSTAFWSPGWRSLRDMTLLPDTAEADILALYWLPRGFLGIRQVGRLLALGKPVVWRLSDMWPFTGGCHYAGECIGFERACGHCPQLASAHPRDLSRALLTAKTRHWRQGDLTVVSPSAWMADAAARSPVLQGRDIRVIPTGVDTDVFRPMDRLAARRVLGLPDAGPLLLFGADDALRDGRKGGSAALAVACELAARAAPDAPAGLVLFGTSKRPDGIPPHVPVHPMGTISEEARLSMLYAACDVFLAPSKQENLANTVLEAMACGTPVVAFGVGGMNEAIVPDRTGLLVRAGDDAALAAATATLLGDAGQRQVLGAAARERVLSAHDLRTQAGRYVELYRELLDRRGANA